MLHACPHNSPPLHLTQLCHDLDIILCGFAPAALGERSELHMEGFQVLGEFGIPLVQSGLDIVLLFFFSLYLACSVQQ